MKLPRHYRYLPVLKRTNNRGGTAPYNGYPVQRTSNAKRLPTPWHYHADKNWIDAPNVSNAYDISAIQFKQSILLPPLNDRWSSFDHEERAWIIDLRCIHQRSDRFSRIMSPLLNCLLERLSVTSSHITQSLREYRALSISCGHFLQATLNGRTIAHPDGRAMVCLLWVQSLKYVFPLLMASCMQYHVILDRDISRTDCITP